MPALVVVGLIVDSGANQHLTYSDKFLVNVIDISNFGIKVAHPNGTEALITKVGNMVLTKDITLYDVLVVPEYCDLREMKCLGIGKQKDGLYYFDESEAAVFRRSPEFAPSDRHDFWTEASLHIKEGFDRWDLDFEAWKFCFLPGQIASCLVIFFLSCSLFVAIYLDIDSKIMMIVVCL
ncbi:hypothetical protein Tco_0553085 [Tanacetum coccineum]